MNSELFSLLVQYQDAQRNLVYLLKNAAYDLRCNDVVNAHSMDIQKAIASCRKVIDDVLMEQHKACN